MGVTNPATTDSDTYAWRSLQKRVGGADVGNEGSTKWAWVAGHNLYALPVEWPGAIFYTYKPYEYDGFKVYPLLIQVCRKKSTPSRKPREKTQ